MNHPFPKAWPGRCMSVFSLRPAVLLIVFICFSNFLLAQSNKSTLLLQGDSVKVTNCDSAELIIENHTQNVPGFLFNTGNGRTIFKRGVVKINDSFYVIGGDTLKLPLSNFWALKGNSGTNPATQFIGTSDTSSLVFRAFNVERMRIFGATGNVGINTGTADNGYRLQVNGNMNATGPVHLIGNLVIAAGYNSGAVGSNAGIRIDNINTSSFYLQGSPSGWATDMFTFSTSLGNICKPLYGIDGSIIKIQSGFNGANTPGLSGNSLSINPTYNIIVGTGYPMTVRGIYYNPIITKLDSGSRHIAMETVSGDVLLGTTSGNTGIHRASPKVLLDLPGPINIDDTSAFRIGYHPMLRVSAFSAGFGYANLFIGDSSAYYIDGSTYNTYVGNLTGVRATGSQNVFVGQLAGYYNAGGWNTFIGTYSGSNNGKTGVKSENNTFLGVASGYANAGSANTLLGLNAGRNNTGDSNMCIGFNAGLANTGVNNCFSGTMTGYGNQGYYNSFMGMSSGAGNRGNQNVFVGYRSGITNVGSDNVFVGHYSGMTDSIISFNKITLIGDSADVGFVLNLSNSTAIGHRAIVKNSNTMVFGDVNVNSWLFNTNATATAGTALVVGSNSSNGNGAYLTTGGVWTNASDRNKKENFSPLDNADILDRIGQLPITRWNYKGLHEQHIGPVAQDFYRIFQVGADDKTISTIDPSGIALAGIQELHRKWQQAEQRANELQSRLEKQEAAMSLQQGQMQELAEKLNKLTIALNNTGMDSKKDMADNQKIK